MSAASRAEARRRAILSRGTDRLAKLTRGAEDEARFTHTPLTRSPSPLAASDPPLATFSDIPHRSASLPPSSLPPFIPEPPNDVPISLIFTPPAAPTRLQKALPLLHLLAVWTLLAYFVLWRRTTMSDDPRWRTWSDLCCRNLQDGTDTLPFIVAFLTLQIVLHSIRIFAGFDTVQPPWLISLVLPYLPPPLPNIILSGLKYIQMAGAFLDDLAAVVVGIGFIVWFSGYVSV